jgi:hypothetical protein
MTFSEGRSLEQIRNDAGDVVEQYFSHSLFDG